MHYLIGDLQGCCDALERLLAEIAFSPSRDHLTVLGDIVNRGPSSLATVKRLQALGSSAEALLGNHDLHLLAVAYGIRPQHAGDTLGDILDDPQRDRWIDWMRQRPLALMQAGWLCVHAGVAPTWDAAQALALAGEVEQMLQGSDPAGFLRTMYGNEPRRWHDDLAGADRLRFIVNVLTRVRFCTADGALDLKTKDGADAAPPGHVPWFDVPGRATAGVPIAFGHWSTLGFVERADLLCLDTGCVWGGTLTAMRVDGGRRELHRVACTQAAVPG
ncbi:symmetrical bis(5'-nucleosyl)-tetraphosphatase [Aquincola sp. MAHUQ-54]|uniref:bis(5'-nucleosyl)-tetraphosphatase (symmetrical) n=1 Tax=Aquincola agrisoli TaxID=3119538 RepID=A0AAW9QEJ9_9BURK